MFVTVHLHKMGSVLVDRIYSDQVTTAPLLPEQMVKSYVSDSHCARASAPEISVITTGA